MTAPEPASRLLPLVLDGPAGPLEALLQERDEHDHELTAVVCHPHPLFGGTMHNKVVHRVASTLHGLGAAVLRFNFRGVGKSAGAFDRGEGELADARVALDFMRERYPAARRWVAGFSFGSWVASRLAAGAPDVERLILIAPPVHTQTFEEMRTYVIPKLVVQGLADDICRPENLAKVWPEWAEPKRLMKVDDASHFFDRHLQGLAEVLLIAVVYGFGILIVWRQYIALDTATWYASPSAAGSQLSLAGMWYGYVSVPIFQFLLLRWYFRLAIWARFLWQVSRIELSLVPTHPDSLGGLSFISGQVYAFSVLAVAHGALLAGNLANRIFFLGAALTDFKVEIALVVIFLLCVVLCPLLFFAPQLAQAKRTGSREYGVLAERYVREFDAKWVRGGTPADEPLVGSADIQSLADMGNSFAVVQNMRIVPIKRDDVLRLVGATLAPIVPLALTMMSLEELLKKLMGVLF